MAIAYRCAGQGWFGDPVLFSAGKCADVVNGSDYPEYFARTGTDNWQNPEELYLYVLIEFYDTETNLPVVVRGTAEFRVSVHGTWNDVYPFPGIPCSASIGWGVPRGSTFEQTDIAHAEAISVSAEDGVITAASVSFSGESKYAFFLWGRTAGSDAAPAPEYVGDQIWVAPSIHQISFSGIQVDVDPVVAGFTAFPVEGIVPLEVQFTDTSENGPTAWLWLFGDEATSDVQNPIHTYTSPGLYSVALAVANDYGQDVIVKEGYILALPPDDSGRSRRRRAAWLNMELLNFGGN